MDEQHRSPVKLAVLFLCVSTLLLGISGCGAEATPTMLPQIGALPTVPATPDAEATPTMPPQIGALPTVPATPDSVNTVTNTAVPPTGLPLGSSQPLDIVGRWRITNKEQVMKDIEFFRDGALSWSGISGKYAFIEGNRLKIDVQNATTTACLYSMIGDTLDLTDCGGMGLHAMTLQRVTATEKPAGGSPSSTSPPPDIVGRWRITNKEQVMKDIEFFRDGTLSWSGISGKYAFIEGNRLKIDVQNATTTACLYSMIGDTLDLTDCGGMGLHAMTLQRAK